MGRLEFSCSRVSDRLTRTKMAEETAPSTPAIGTRDKSVAWYHPTLKNLPQETKELLKTYSEIPEEEIEAHIHSVVSKFPRQPRR